METDELNTSTNVINPKEIPPYNPLQNSILNQLLNKNLLPNIL